MRKKVGTEWVDLGPGGGQSAEFGLDTEGRVVHTSLPAGYEPSDDERDERESEVDDDDDE